jgi:HNH endonuclease
VSATCPLWANSGHGSTQNGTLMGFAVRWRNIWFLTGAISHSKHLLNSCYSALIYLAFREIFWLPMLTAKRLRKVVSYAPTSGIFRWKVSAGSRAPVGAIAGAKNGRGYHQIRIGGRPYSASRLAWLYMTGKWPNSEISYHNGKPSDTRWANLQEAPSSQNRSRPKRK